MFAAAAELEISGAALHLPRPGAARPGDVRDRNANIDRRARDFPDWIPDRELFCEMQIRELGRDGLRCRIDRPRPGIEVAGRGAGTPSDFPPPRLSRINNIGETGENKKQETDANKRSAHN